MPFRRRGDGQVVDERTEVVRDQDAQPTRGDKSGADRPTEPIEKTRSRESLFEAQSGRTRVWRQGQGPDQSPGRQRQHRAMDDPPTGWLVVVRGPGQGQVLTLGSGMNAIGRGEPSRVRLDFGDDSVSASNHARLIYEPRRRRWLLSHGDGTNLTYLNDEVVVETVEIESGAEIQIGETILRFQAFCSAKFDWSDIGD